MNASHSDLVACHYCPVGPARLLPLDIRRIRILWLADVSRDGPIWSVADSLDQNEEPMDGEAFIPTRPSLLSRHFTAQLVSHVS